MTRAVQPDDVTVIAAQRGGVWGALVLVAGVEVFLPWAAARKLKRELAQACDVIEGVHPAQVVTAAPGSIIERSRGVIAQYEDVARHREARRQHGLMPDHLDRAGQPFLKNLRQGFARWLAAIGRGEEALRRWWCA